MGRLFKHSPDNDLYNRIDNLEYRVTELQLLLSHQAEMVSSLTSVYNDIIKIFYEYSESDIESNQAGRIVMLATDDDDEFLN